MMNIELEQAIRIFQQYNHKKQFLQVELLQALGKICGESIYAPINQPPFNRSPLDGYALIAEDTKEIGQQNKAFITLKVVDEIYAGTYAETIVQRGEAVRIMTGAPIPQGANCIVRQENTDYGSEVVKVYEKLEPYDNYCFSGEDIQKGTCVITKGTKIEYKHIGVLASLGFATIKVVKPLVIGLLNTGDEIVNPGEALEPGKIYNANGYILRARLQELGFEVKYIERCEDCAEEVANIIKKQIMDCDLFLTTGGVSVGIKDIMHDVIKKMPAKKLFWKINIKPGTPIIAAIYKGKPMICLSGNPFAAITTFEIFVRPVLGRLIIDKRVAPERRHAEVQSDFNKPSNKRRFLRCYYNDGIVTIPTKHHSSGMLYSMLSCNALLDIPAGNEGIKKGDLCDVVIL